jgi:hypothetical protein
LLFGLGLGGGGGSSPTAKLESGAKAMTAKATAQARNHIGMPNLNMECFSSGSGAEPISTSEEYRKKTGTAVTGM